jgi:hypothetical protein
LGTFFVSPYLPLFFYSVFCAFLSARGVQKHDKLCVKKTMPKAFYKKVKGKREKTICFLGFFNRVFGCFSGGGVKKRHKCVCQNNSPENLKNLPQKKVGR